jgi:hypothetical protein
MHWTFSNVASGALLIAIFGVFAVRTIIAIVRFLSALHSTRVKVRVVEHQLKDPAETDRAYYILLYEVLDPKALAGRFGVAATLRGDLIAGADGREFEVWLNFTMIGTLTNRPLAYSCSAPQSKCGDFLEMATRVR